MDFLFYRITLTEIPDTVQSIFRGLKYKSSGITMWSNNIGGYIMDHPSLGFFFDLFYYLGVPVLIIFILDTLRKKSNKKEEKIHID